jgi:hypothetical protein
VAQRAQEFWIMFAGNISLSPALAPRKPLVRATGATEGFALGTRLRSVVGPRRVEDLRVGDLLLDRNARVITLQSIRRHEDGPELVQIDPTAFGLGVHPARLHPKLVVGAGQRLGVRDWRTDILFGAASLTPARALVDGVHVHRMAQAAALFQLGFGEDVLLDIGGLIAQVRG